MLSPRHIAIGAVVAGALVVDTAATVTGAAVRAVGVSRADEDSEDERDLAGMASLSLWSV